jgi:hypothetical protein
MAKAPTSIPPPRAWTIITTDRTRRQREQLAEEISRIPSETLRTNLRQTLSRLTMFLEDDLERWLARTEGVGFMLPTGILKEDAAIIDEQEYHVVLTVRLPIDAIRDNHAMLMALSEIATRQTDAPAEDDPDLLAKTPKKDNHD